MSAAPDLAVSTLEGRLAHVVELALPKVGPEVRGQLEAMLQPEMLAIVAGFLVAWIVSHAVGIGQIVDIIFLVVGVASIGWAIFSGIDHLYDFAMLTYGGSSPREFEEAADHLAAAIGILGIQAVLAVLFRGAKAPNTGRGGQISPGAPPPRTPGARYKPTIQADPTLPPGQGATSFWGDIRFSARGTPEDRALVLLHERVHQMLAPKLYLLRNYRVSNRVSSYVRSSLYRYIEEALAETVAQVGVFGIRRFFHGVRFPVDNGYVHMLRPGGYHPQFGGHGVAREVGALLYATVVAGIAIELRFEPGSGDDL